MDTLMVLGLMIASFVTGLWVGRRGGVPVAPPTPVAPPPPEKMEEIRRIAAGGEKIRAIKMYRDSTGAGLKEAKEAVDRLEEQ